jgi:hypothetical protein
MGLPHKEKLKLSIYFKDVMTTYHKESHISEENKESTPAEAKIIKEGIVKKKSPWFHYNTRRLVLYSNHKIEYIDPFTHSVKGVIILTKDCKSLLMETERFDLVTPNRTFTFRVK